MEDEGRVVRDGSDLLADGGVDHVGGLVALCEEGGAGGVDGLSVGHGGGGGGGRGGGCCQGAGHADDTVEILSVHMLLGYVLCFNLRRLISRNDSDGLGCELGGGEPSSWRRSGRGEGCSSLRRSLGGEVGDGARATDGCWELHSCVGVLAGLDTLLLSSWCNGWEEVVGSGSSTLLDDGIAALGNGLTLREVTWPLTKSSETSGSGNSGCA